MRQCETCRHWVRKETHSRGGWGPPPFSGDPEGTIGECRLYPPQVIPVHPGVSPIPVGYEHPVTRATHHCGQWALQESGGNL